MGSSGQKPRKGKHQQHLPKVGSEANREYEFREKQKQYFYGWPIAIVVVILGIVFFAWIAIT